MGSSEEKNITHMDAFIEKNLLRIWADARNCLSEKEVKRVTSGYRHYTKKKEEISIKIYGILCDRFSKKLA